MTRDLEFSFQIELLFDVQVIERLISENLNEVKSSIKRKGGVNVVKQILEKYPKSDNPSPLFVKLAKIRRLDASFEALIIHDDYYGLFTVEELDLASRRLARFGFKFESPYEYRGRTDSKTVNISFTENWRV